MTLPNKTRLAKRKLEIKEVRKEKQTATSKKHDKKCFTVENPSPKVSNKTKAEILEDMDLMKQLNDALLEEVKANEEAIAKLERKEKKYIADIKDLEQKLEISNRSTNDVISSGSQTQFNDIKLCSECEYPCDDLYDLGEHMGETHTDRNVCNSCDEIFQTQESLVEHIMKQHKAVFDSTVEDSFCCNFCDKTFRGKNELMSHKKMEHTVHVRQCWNYSTETCMYGETDCWFIHKGQSSVLEFKCKLCDEHFFNRSELQQHRKSIHPNTIPMCKNILNGGRCLFDKNCLFKHVESETSEIIKLENSEVMMKILDFMEKVTERIDRIGKIELHTEN